MADPPRQQRRQWDTAPDLSLRALADSQSMELPEALPQRRAMQSGGTSASLQSSTEFGQDSVLHDSPGEHLWDGESTIAESVHAPSTMGRPPSRPAAHNITKMDLQVLRDSMMELDLHMAESVASYRGPDTIIEDDDAGDSDFSYSDVDEDFESYNGSDGELSPCYASKPSETRIMSATPPTRVSRELTPARPGSGRPISAAGARPLSGAPVRPREVPRGRDSQGDLAGVLEALSQENEAALRSSQGKEAIKPPKPVMTPTKSGQAGPAKGSQAAPSPAARGAGLPPAKKDRSPTKLPPRAKGVRGGPRVDVPRFSARDSLADSLDTPGATIKRISGRLARLDPNKQRILQQVLEKLEKAEAAGSINVSAMFSSLATNTPKGKHPTGAPPSSSKAVAAPPPPPCRQEVVLRILSAHGSGPEVGLTEVELFDDKGERIEVLPEDVSVRGGSGDAESGATVGRLASGRARTVNPRHMWLGRLGGRALEVVVRTPAESRPAARLLLWNYNKSMHDLGLGVREMQVYVDGDLTWQGVVSKGCGNHTFDYSTAINIIEMPEPLQPPSAAPEAPSALADKSGSTSQPLSRLGSGKALDELSNEELLEELKRRSLPMSGGEQKEPRKPPQAAAPAGPSQAKEAKEASSDGSPAKPGHRTKLEGLRSRLSARRGGKAPTAGRAPEEAGKAAAAGAAPAEESAGGPIWLAGASKQQPAAAEGGKAGGGRAVSNLLSRRRRSSETGEPSAAAAAACSSGAAVPTASPPPPPSSTATGAGNGVAATEKDKESSEIYGLLGTRSRPVSGRRASRPNSAASPAVAPERPPVAAQPKPKAAAGRPRGVTASELESSLDSLEFFQKTQAGRLDKSISIAKSRLGAAAGGAGDKPAKGESMEDMDALIQAELAMMDEDDLLIRDELENLVSSKVPPADAANKQSAGTLDAKAPLGFVVPTAPSGRLLELVIHSTWGDAHYVGLCGIELFNTKGQPITVSDPERQVSATPASINELAEYAADPRTPDKLVDGVNMTCDDLHVWLAPYTKGAVNRISITLDSVQDLGMLRVWNYNKNRIHSQRGARKVEIGLDGELIFYGDIRRAPGSMAEAPSAAECILFSDAEEMLQAVEESDMKYHRARLEAQRSGTPPSSADRLASEASPLEIVTNDGDDPLGLGAGKVGSDGRPMTSAVHQPTAAAGPASRLGAITADSPPSSGAAGGPSPAMPGLVGRELKMVILATWGDPYYMGLTGLEVLGPRGQPLPLTRASLDACPRDLNAIPGYLGDDRTLDKLLDGTNLTTNDAHMWLAPMKMSTLSGGPVNADDPNGWLTVTLGTAPVEITGLRIWNYNKSLEDTTRGLKAVQLLLDGKPISPPGGHLLCKAPGVGSFDFGQTLRLHPSLAGAAPPLAAGQGTLAAGLEASAWIHAMPDPVRAQQVWTAARKARNHSAVLRQDFDTPLLPCGFVLKLLLLSSWGDQHYLGLTGVELVDAVRGPIQVMPQQVSASPRSVADLPGMQRDVRLPSRVVDRPNTAAASHSWLAPLVKHDVGGDNRGWEPNTLTIALESPVMLSAIRLWNYAKTPARGVQEIEVLLDDLMIFKGYVRCAPTGSQGPWQHSILFHNAPEFLQTESPSAYSHLATMEREGPIMLVNDRKLAPGSAKASLYSEPGDRPTTSVVAH
eukprot:jgi/Tetstr1/462326/TSEL_007333.t2